MFSIFRNREKDSSPAKKNRGFKITTTQRSRKIGIAASSLMILKKKAAEKLNIAKCRIYLSTDGTEIDDEEYFATVPDQTLLVIAGEKEEMKTDFQLMLDIFRTSNAELLSAAEGTREYVENNRDKIKTWLEDLLKSSTDGGIANEKLSTKADHPAWFQGTDSKYNTKEEAMRRRAQDRIRGYFYKAKDELTKCESYRSSETGRRHINELLRLFRIVLHGCDYFGCLFDRSAIKDETDSGEPLNKRTKQAIANSFEEENIFEEQCRTLCHPTGSFACQGQWDREQCLEEHSINPYKSRESLIVFQTWNLDHQIEFGRSVIPSIIQSLKSIIDEEEKPKCPVHKDAPATSLNGIRCFLELFTLANLKLVHIACHIKEVHSSLISKSGVLCQECPDFKRMEVLLNKFKNVN